MKRHHISSSAVWFGLVLALGSTIVPAFMIAGDTSPIVGKWEGILDPGAQPKQQIVVHLSQSHDGILSGTIDYPDQNITGIPITAINYKEPALHFESQSIHASYDGTMRQDNSEISGNWKAWSGSGPLVFKRSE